MTKTLSVLNPELVTTNNILRRITMSTTDYIHRCRSPNQSLLDRHKLLLPTLLQELSRYRTRDNLRQLLDKRLLQR